CLSSSSSYYFITLQRPPPTSTLFPYTTLFRSAKVATVRAAHAAEQRHNTHAGQPAPDQRRGLDLRHPLFNARDLLQRPAAEGDPDRKSTRLNSSHLGISYAVFCLKKKKITQVI